MAHTHRNRIVSRVAWTLASYAAVLALWLTSCAFAETLPNIDWARRQMADERLTAFGDDMFGDGIDPHTGSITFFQTDVSLPGNSHLPVAIARRRIQGVLTVGNPNGAEFGDWELRVPRMRVTSAAQRPWTGSCTTPFATTFSGVVWNGAVVSRNQYSNGIMVEVGDSDTPLLEFASGPQWPAGATHATTTNWYFTCGANNTFVGHAPNGDVYRFDRLIEREAESMSFVNGVDLPRKIYILAATQVTDVNGNWVNYTYDASGRLTQISSNDGRTITLELLPVLRTPSLGVLVRSESDDGTAQGIYA